MKGDPRREVLFGAFILGLSLGSGPETIRADWFIRGDADASGRLTITDPIRIFRHLFLGDLPAPSCLDAADADGNGRLELTDGILVLQYLFLGGDSPKAPFPDCSISLGDVTLGCAGFPPCASIGVFYTICFGPDGSVREDFIRQLAEESGGRYERVLK